MDMKNNYFEPMVEASRETVKPLKRFPLRQRAFTPS
jgi:hypothetical protein